MIFTIFVKLLDIIIFRVRSISGEINLVKRIIYILIYTYFESVFRRKLQGLFVIIGRDTDKFLFYSQPIISKRYESIIVITFIQFCRSKIE